MFVATQLRKNSSSLLHGRLMDVVIELVQCNLSLPQANAGWPGVLDANLSGWVTVVARNTRRPGSSQPMPTVPPQARKDDGHER